MKGENWKSICSVYVWIYVLDLHTWTVVTPFKCVHRFTFPCHVSVIQHHKNDCVRYIFERWMFESGELLLRLISLERGRALCCHGPKLRFITADAKQFMKYRGYKQLFSSIMNRLRWLRLTVWEKLLFHPRTLLRIIISLIYWRKDYWKITFWF